MTLNITVEMAILIEDPDLLGMDTQQRAAFAQNAVVAAQDRVADWFRGHPAKITATANLEAPSQQS